MRDVQVQQVAMLTHEGPVGIAERHWLAGGHQLLGNVDRQDLALAA